MNPSEIDLLTLPSLSLEQRSQLPNTCCIYFAIDSQDIVQYIGRSLDLQQRWTQHHRQCQLQNMDGVRIAWLTVDAPELLPEIEKALISWFAPRLNGCRNPDELLNKSIRLKRLREKIRLLEADVSPSSKIEKPLSKSIDLKQLRENVCLNTTDVASRLKIGEPTVRNWEAGRSFPHFLVIKKLLELYQCSFDDLHSAVVASQKKANYILED